jgi:nucleotide-binding universal stress UspA family protein
MPLHLIHCIADWMAPAELPASRFLDSDARATLVAESLRLTRPGLEITTELFYGSASHHLAAAATSDVCFVVLGSTGKGAMQKLMLGSVSEHVAQASGVPVLIVKNAQSLLNWLLNRTSLRTLCAAELTETGDAAVEAIHHLSRLGELFLEIGHIIPTDLLLIQATGFLNPPVKDEQDATDDVVSLQRDMAEQSMHALGITPQAVHVREALGNPAYEFLSLAHEHQVELIVLGSHHRHGVSRFLHPSFSRRILNHATANILCVPASTPVEPGARPHLGEARELATNID